MWNQQLWKELHDLEGRMARVEAELSEIRGKSAEKAAYHSVLWRLAPLIVMVVSTAFAVLFGLRLI